MNTAHPELVLLIFATALVLWWLDSQTRRTQLVVGGLYLVLLVALMSWGIADIRKNGLLRPISWMPGNVAIPGK